MTEEKEATFYEQLCAIDIISPIMNLWRQNGVSYDRVTKKLSLERKIGFDRTWTFAKIDQERKCAKWLDIYFEYYKILSPPCKQCWKIVYVPQGLTELIDMQRVQAKMGLPAKCGTEQRGYTSGLGGYRAFWYCPFYEGLKGARTYFQRIKNALIKYFSKDLIEARQTNGQFFLKRGCTELERDFGPSEGWDKIDHSAKFNLLEACWEDSNEMTEEWGPLVYTNLIRWIEYAIAHNDRDALNYVRGKSLGVPAVRYQDSDHKPEQFPLYMNPLNGSDQKDKKETQDETKKDLFRFESAKS